MQTDMKTTKVIIRGCMELQHWFNGFAVASLAAWIITWFNIRTNEKINEEIHRLTRENLESIIDTLSRLVEHAKYTDSNIEQLTKNVDALQDKMGEMKKNTEQAQ